MAFQLNQDYIKNKFATINDPSHIFYSLIENADYGLALISLDFMVLEVNKKMLAWFPETAVEQTPFCYKSFYFLPKDNLCPGCPAEKALQDGKKHSALLKDFSRNKDPLCYKVTCAPITNSEGEIWGILEIAEDITEKIMLKNKLQELELRHSQLIENANDAIISYNTNGEIIQFNRKAQELFGYTQDEVFGKKFFLLIPEEKKETQQIAFQKIISSGGSAGLGNIIEGLCKKKDGTIFPIEATHSFQKTIQGCVITTIARDISKRKLSEQALQTYTKTLEQKVDNCTRDHTYLEEQYGILVATANDAIVSTDKNGKIIYFNRKAEELYGYQKDEVLGKNISVITPKEIWNMAQTGLQIDNGHFKNQPGKTLESWGITRDKTTFPVEFTLSVFEGNDEPYFTAIVRDISKRKKLEQKLQEYTTTLEQRVKERTYELTKSQQILNEKLAELSIINEIGEALASTMDLETVLDIILVGATSHHGLGFNRAFLFLLNDDASYLQGKVAIGPSDPQEAHKIWSGILGKQLSLKEILQSYTNQQGKVDTHVNDLVKSIGIPMGGEENIFIQVIRNKKSLNIKNAAKNSLIPNEIINLMNCNAFALVPLIARDKILGVLWADNAITKKTIMARDVERLRTFANNASLAIENSYLYSKLQEKLKELDRAYQELKENKDRLVRSEKLAAVGEMSATVAHGIRNPLTAIGGFARRLLKKEGEENFNRKYLKIIVDEIDRLENLLTEILDFVRPKELHLKKVCIHDIIDDTLQILNLNLQKRGISVVKNFYPNLLMVNIDIDQFKRVIINLYNNAMEAMPNGGTLTITTRFEDSWVMIIFEDTGIGISSGDIEKVFHPFFTRKSTGTGLGLAVCNQIVSIHGGTIKLRKQAPSGAIFEIYLPMYQSEMQA